jgi:hypothetical protein
MNMPVIELYIVAVALSAVVVGVLGTRMNTRTRPAGQREVPLAKVA